MNGMDFTSPRSGGRPGLVDAHHHLWDTRRRSYRWMTDDVAAIRRPFLVEDLERATAPTGVTAIVAVQAATAVEETRELLAAAAADAGLPYDLLVRARELPAAVETARALGDAAFVLDHLGKPPLAGGGLAAWRRVRRSRGVHET